MNAPKKRRSSKGTVAAAAAVDPDAEEEQREDTTPFIYVVEVAPSCDENLRNFHETLFTVMEKSGIQPKWMTRSEVVSVRVSSPDFYVLPQFEGPEFEHLLQRGCKVIGPFVVDRCLKKGERLPKWNHPIYALPMQSAVVCFSAYSKNKKNELTQLVLRMGGTVSNDLHDKVTVLIAPQCDTKFAKYTESAKLKIPILREDWITDSWKEITDTLKDEPVTNMAVYDQYRVPLFKSMVICVSGLSKEDLSMATNLIELGKGTFNREMSKTTCTHLITNKNSGEKFKKAREWKSIRIVTLRWLQKSVEAGYVQKETHYDPERVRASTPTKGAKPPDELDFSMVAPAPPPIGGFNQSHLSSGLNSTSNTTVRTTNESVVKASFMRHDSSRRLMDSMSEEKTDEGGRMMDATIDIEMNTMNGDEDFFEGLRIFLVGVPEVRESWWKKMLNWSGASRSMRVEGATHVVVVAGVVDKSLLSCGKPVVTTEWVKACMKAKRIVSHSDFIYNPSASSAALSSSSLNQSLITSVNGPMRKTPAKSTQITRGILSQQIHATPSLSTITPVPSISTHSSTSLRRSTNLPPPSSSVGVGRILAGVTFKMSGDLSAEETQQLTSIIKEKGGSVIASSSSSPAHYLLCTLLDYGSIVSPLNHNTHDIVSVFWLYHCIDFSSLISPSSHPLFRPLPACRNSRAFEGLVVRMAGFPYEQEQVAYESLLEQFGARVGGGNDGVKTSSRVTHIVLGGPLKEGRLPTGSRSVDPSWIIECIVHDKILLEDDYPFKTKAYTTYGGRTDDLWAWERCEERRGGSRAEGGEEMMGVMSGRGGGGSRIVEDQEMECDENSDAILDMRAFDDEEGGEEMERTEGGDMDDNREEDSMVREITNEMEERREEEEEGSERRNEMRGGGNSRVATQHVAPSMNSPFTTSIFSTSTPRGKSAAVMGGGGGVAHPRLKMLRSVATPSSSHGGPIPTTSSPSQFLHPSAHPKIVIPGVDELLDEISSPAHSEMDRSIDQLSASGVGRMLDGMVMTTGRRNSDGLMVETPLRGGTSELEERGEMMMVSAARGTSSSSTTFTRNILDSAKIERREIRGEEREEEVERETIEVMDITNDTMMDMDDDSPRDSVYELPEETAKKRRELMHQMAASLAVMRNKEEEDKEKAEAAAAAAAAAAASTSSGTSSEMEGGGVKIGGGRSRRKRLHLGPPPMLEIKRPPPSTTPDDVKTQQFPVHPIVGWAETPVGPMDFDNMADNSRLLDSPVKVTVKKDPTLPATVKTATAKVADRSMASRTMNKSNVTVRPTPAKTLRPRLDEKTQVIDLAADDIVGEKSSKKSKSTAAISRRGRGKENEAVGKVFAFTSIEGGIVVRDKMMEAVRKLGGSISPSDAYDPMVTHIICGKLVRNERILSAIASNQHLLKQSYVMESEKEKKWAEEGDHEWCNEKGANDKTMMLVKATVRWKRDLQMQKNDQLVDGGNGKIGSFVSWRALFYYTSREKAIPMTRLVCAGGGQIMIRDQVTIDDIKEMKPTHVLVEGNGSSQWTIEELRVVHALKAKVFSFDYIFRFLVCEKLEERSCFLPEYKNILICEE